ncbi:hypothetical protein IC619_013870 [Hazenella sp. IB182353]|uniref:hypothetical protein n=1 Tax=Polycladospora coralii TaxID=2771432 RepID=UPI001746FA95|nr:hypothetical protein [Polycladospora coralii]MBS7531571.1 hypothetical protein [Polycladospora coralii]
MNLREEFDEISIRGRIAYGVTCMNELCKKRRINSSKMISFLELIKSGTKTNDFTQIELAVPEYYPKDESLKELAIAFGFDHLSIDQQKIVEIALEELTYTTLGNIYAGYRSEYTLEPLINLIQILKDNDIVLPDSKPFKKSKSTEQNGWGKSVPFEYFQSNK